ncbi:MAG: nuclease-related domain-containing protein [Sporolactobacillus sp.]
MFIKPIQLPHFIEQYHAYVLRTRSRPERAILGEQLRNYQAGFNGEKSLEPHLRALNSRDFLILHDLRLFNLIYYFQMDFLLLHPSCLIVLEVKNLAGTLSLDCTNHQLTRLFKQEEEIFPDPLVQSRALTQQLRDWLVIHYPQLAEIPIHDHVVFSSPGTFINFSNGSLSEKQRIIRGPEVTQQVSKIIDSMPAPVLTMKTLRQIGNKLLADNHPKTIDLLRSGTLQENQIMKGVRCPSCGHLPMKRIVHSWQCPNCHKNAQKAHLASLRDYQLIYGSRITNQQCRDFLQIESESTSRFLLQSMHLKSSGKTRTKTYYLNF